MAVGLLGLSLMACGSKTAPANDFVTVVADIGDVRDIVPATGALISVNAAEVRAPQAGVVTAVYVKEGDRVQPGQVLAALEDPGRQAAEREATAEAQAISASMTEAEIALRSARLELDRRLTLQRGGFVSPAAIQTAEVEVERAEAGLSRARHQHRASQARLLSVAAKGQASEIRALLGGVVTLVLARVGQRVSPDDERPLFKTDNQGKELTLEIMIAETDLARVDLDSQVSFTVDAFPDIRNEARLVSISPAPIKEGRFTSYRALATYDNAAGVLTPGMSASVELTQANSSRVLRIPAQALHYRPPSYMPPLSDEELERLKSDYANDMELVRAAAGGAEFGRNLRRGVRLIFVLEDGKPQRREVRIGAQTNDHVEVLSGVSKGEVIIVRGPDERRR